MGDGSGEMGDGRWETRGLGDGETRRRGDWEMGEMIFNPKSKIKRWDAIYGE
jgi:hypothetical protein